MSLIKRDSATALTDKLFTQWWSDWPDAVRELVESADLTPMRVEEFEEDGTLVVRAEMPGLDPEKDVDVSVTDHVLRIRAERREEHKSEDKKSFRSEFRYGSFARTITLPAGASEDDVKATYTDGILEVRVPIDSTDAGAKRIPGTRT